MRRDKESYLICSQKAVCVEEKALIVRLFESIAHRDMNSKYWFLIGEKN